MQKPQPADLQREILTRLDEITAELTRLRIALEHRDRILMGAVEQHELGQSTRLEIGEQSDAAMALYHQTMQPTRPTTDDTEED
jgi:hypothetical protein